MYIFQEIDDSTSNVKGFSVYKPRVNTKRSHNENL
jgi:hypothetical protein